jgi:hypothetical protein
MKRLITGTRMITLSTAMLIPALPMAQKCRMAFKRRQLERHEEIGKAREEKSKTAWQRGSGRLSR